ncbi:hypothetical protein MAHJHV55_33280 [Mycobacterium avium subsp. hominissuis]
MDIKLAGEVLGWVTKEARERSLYSGRGESRIVTGREYDANGAPVSGVESVIVSDALGVTPGATVVMPDSLAADLPVGRQTVGHDDGGARRDAEGIADDH